MTKYNPDHYQGEIQPWDYIYAQDLNYFQGNVIKYVTRAGRKEGETALDDYVKAAAYLRKLIEDASRAPRSDEPGEAVSPDNEPADSVQPDEPSDPVPADKGRVRRIF